MQRAGGGRLVASVTSLLVAVAAVLVVLAAPTASAADHHRSGHHTSDRHPKVSFTATVTAHAAVRRAFVSTVRRTGKATATVVSHGPKGKPDGKATRSATVHVVVKHRSTAKLGAEATASATAKAATKKKAKAKAQALARQKAEKKAVKKSAKKSHHRAVVKARHKATRKADRLAHRRAVQKAHRKARHIARLRRIDPKDPTTWIKSTPRYFTPKFGPMFNNPYARLSKRRALLTQVIRAVKSSPGYKLTTDPDTGKKLKCPRNPVYYPSTIKIAVYSIADKRFAKAIVNAHRRCVSVQVLMNSHLDRTTSRSWGRIGHALGGRSRKYWRHQRSFAHRCSNGCLGTSVLHSKFFLFSHPGKARYTVMTGSTNMTKNAIGVQWNDLYTVNGNKQLFGQFKHMFKKMVRDRMANGPYVFKSGRYTTVFYPFRKATERSDRTMRSLKSIQCRGAKDGTGINGRTVVYIAMHAWFSDRGLYLAKRVRHMYDKGCYVRILYSFMSRPTFDILKRGTGHRMVVRRVLFPGPLGLHAAKYSHMKMYAASGHIGKDHAARMVWTGSNNFQRKSLHADEVTLRIHSASAYRAYVRHWRFMRNLRSSPYWAKYEEPEGGGRAP